MGAQGSKEGDVFLDAATDLEGPSEPELLVTPGGTKKAATKLYRHQPGTLKWVLASAVPKWRFEERDTLDTSDDDKSSQDENNSSEWCLVVPGWFALPVSDKIRFKFDDDARRVDFHSIAKGVFCLRFGTTAEYSRFVDEYKRAMFENTYRMDFNEANVNKVYGKEFAKGWHEGEETDEVMWDAEDQLSGSESESTPTEGYNEAIRGKHSPLGLTMGALENSFLVHATGVDVLQNEEQGVHNRGVTINLTGGGSSASRTPRKAMLIRGETGMLFMSPSKGDSPHASGVRQVDLEKEKVVAEWKFEKDGTPITMRDVMGDTKSSQLDPGQATFLGLDDNRLCRWDMRDRNGIVQQLASPGPLTWSEGHQFSRGTNFRCFATTGDGCVAVGSSDGKIRLYSTTSMRQAKTAFPGFGQPVTHIDVTYDGKYVLATTDYALILVSTMWRDEKGQKKSAFTSRGSSSLGAPRLLQLLPRHAAIAGPDYKFQNGCFSWVTESGKTERHIVAAVKEYSVVWNLASVRQTQHACYQASQAAGFKTCTCYTVVQRGESVVDSKFMHEKFMRTDLEDAPLVIATPHELASMRIPGGTGARAGREGGRDR